MKRCDACNVLVNSRVKHCPLCYTTLNPLDNDPIQPIYPMIVSESAQISLVLKVLALISFSVIAICITINLLTPINFPWSLVVTICLVYVWWAFGNAVRKHDKFGYHLMMQLIGLGLVLLIFSKLFNFEYGFYNYILPGMAGSALLSFDILLIIQRKDIRNIFVYFLTIALFGFLPLALYGLGVIVVAWPAACCGVYSIISIFGLLIFGFTMTKNEFQKRFHL